MFIKQYIKPCNGPIATASNKVQHMACYSSDSASYVFTCKKGGVLQTQDTHLYPIIRARCPFRTLGTGVCSQDPDTKVLSASLCNGYGELSDGRLSGYSTESQLTMDRSV